MSLGNLLAMDQIAIETQRSMIRILEAELEEIRGVVVNPKDTQGITDKQSEYDAKRKEVADAIRDLRAFTRAAVDRYNNHIASTPTPSSLNDGNPEKIAGALDEIMSDIRYKLQVAATIKPAQQNAKAHASTSMNSRSIIARPVAGPSHSFPSKSIATVVLWDDPKRAGPFTSNPKKPLFKFRKEKGYCTRCGMNNHLGDKCLVYPNLKTNVENYKIWQGISDNYLRDGKGGINYNTRSIHPVEEEDRSTYGGEHSSQSVNKDTGTLYEIDETDEAFNIATVDNYISGASASTREYPHHFLVEVIMVHPESKKCIPARALLDSGASRSFMAESFANKHRIPFTELVKVKKLTLADCSPATPIKYQAHLMTLQINSHFEKISLPLFDTKLYDLILGLDWLTYHNPDVDWELRSITFGSYICKHPLGPHRIPSSSRHVIAFSREEITQKSQVRPLKVPEMTDKEKESLPPNNWLKTKYGHIFDMEKQAHLPPHRGSWDFDVNFQSDAALPKSRPLFRLPEQQKRLIEEYIANELNSGKLRLSNSPVGANLFFVHKGDSTTELWPCVDYRDPNSCTVDDRYPLPPIADLIQKLVGADWYAKFDWRWAYNNIRIKEGSEWKFAIKCHLGLYEPLVMPFRPKQAPSHMQRFVTEHCKDFIEEQ
ncbi:hypothetical protein SeLEV6574_g04601 [Synchytrium endobioticum]|uniref:Reverse transcriptase domain-containing protein n=1 Tax=Synchytrium endobioticum TaxID=286115 RepID=A0A507CYK1_9FUNG|nr:hypothetical protein SeLEV6574_g04601 [Synchytrium endobioticum]